jgi:hypothetical protein
MSGLCFNLQLARAAVEYVRRQLPRGPGNQPGSPPDGRACVQYLRDTTVCAVNFIPRLARRAVEVGCGNCGEQAAVAFMYLLARGARPLDYLSLLGSHGHAVHAFVVLAFCPEDDTSSSRWGPDAVICDPWEGRAYPAWQIGLNMSLYRIGRTVRSERRDC